MRRIYIAIITLTLTSCAQPVPKSFYIIQDRYPESGSRVFCTDEDSDEESPCDEAPHSLLLDKTKPVLPPPVPSKPVSEKPKQSLPPNAPLPQDIHACYDRQDNARKLCVEYSTKNSTGSEYNKIFSQCMQSQGFSNGSSDCSNTN